ncbi:hypothetical protein Gpo141_00013040 [Globisporangium polare]
MQDDLIYANLTVVEHLAFQVEVRMDKVSTKEERMERVASIINELGLTKVTNTPIGDALVKGLSGGRRKRLLFAMELLMNPSLHCTVYDGKASKRVAYYAQQNHQCPSFMNPTKNFMKQLVVIDDQPGSNGRVQQLITA